MKDDWVAQLRKLHDDDKARHQAEAEEKKDSRQKQQEKAIALLHNSRAHELLRIVQKNLLAGKGALNVYENPRKYERAIVLAWQGPLSNARRPNAKDPENYNYILVGVRDEKLWVNDVSVDFSDPNAFKAALLQAGKNPETQKPNPEHSE